MNKILLAGVLLFAGGFLLADAAGLDLLANASSSFSGSDRKAAMASVTPYPGATVEACRTAQKNAESEYRLAMQALKEKREMSGRAMSLCVRKVNDVRKSTSPKPSVSPRVVR